MQKIMQISLQKNLIKFFVIQLKLWCATSKYKSKPPILLTVCS